MEFNARPGETVAIVGPSGSGKTTLVKVLAGLLDRTEGTLTAAGRDVRDWDKAAYRSRIGVVMQDDHLFVGTIEDNISFFDPQHDPAKVRECAKLAMIDEDISAMPMGYNTIVGSLGVALSGGQRSRVLLARALYRQPQILFLDETFDQLDLARERAITDGLRHTGIGLVIVSHRPETVGAVDRIVRLGTAEATAANENGARRRRSFARSPGTTSRAERLRRRAGSSATPGTARPSACARLAKRGTARCPPPASCRHSRSGTPSPCRAPAPPAGSADTRTGCSLQVDQLPRPGRRIRVAVGGGTGRKGGGGSEEEGVGGFHGRKSGRKRAPIKLPGSVPDGLAGGQLTNRKAVGGIAGAWSAKKRRPSAP